MRLGSKFIVAAAILVSLGLLALLSQVSMKVDLPAAGASPPPLSLGSVIWFVAWVAFAATGVAIVCVFALGLLRRILKPRPLP